MPKQKPKPPGGKGREEAFKAAMTGLAMMVAGAGLPGQIRLASREEQRPRPPVKGKRR